MPSWAHVTFFSSRPRVMLLHRRVTARFFYLFHASSPICVTRLALLKRRPPFHGGSHPPLILAVIHHLSLRSSSTLRGGHAPHFLAVILHPSWWSSSTHPPSCGQPPLYLSWLTISISVNHHLIPPIKCRCFTGGGVNKKGLVEAGKGGHPTQQ